MGVIPSGMVRNAAMERGRSDFGRKLSEVLDRFLAQRSGAPFLSRCCGQSRDDIKRRHGPIFQASAIAVSGGNRSAAASGRRSNLSSQHEESTAGT